ncbi:hypothetical protein RhiirA4_427235, partial [Rhizophagus irregularis]
IGTLHISFKKVSVKPFHVSAKPFMYRRDPSLWIGIGWDLWSNIGWRGPLDGIGWDFWIEERTNKQERLPPRLFSSKQEPDEAVPKIKKNKKKETNQKNYYVKILYFETIPFQKLI